MHSVKCKKCGFFYASTSVLNRHLKTCKGPKLCVHCNSKIPKERASFQCLTCATKCAKCGYIFTHASLWRHRKICTGKKCVDCKIKIARECNGTRCQNCKELRHNVTNLRYTHSWKGALKMKIYQTKILEKKIAKRTTLKQQRRILSAHKLAEKLYGEV